MSHGRSEALSPTMGVMLDDVLGMVPGRLQVPLSKVNSMNNVSRSI